MELDAFTVNVLVGVSTLAGGIMFLLETMLRRETRAGQIWALSLMCGMLTAISYLIWKAVPDPWVAIAVGNGALVAAMGCLWLGFRRYSGAGLKATGTVVAVLCVVGVASVYGASSLLNSGQVGSAFALRQAFGVVVGGLVASVLARLGLERTTQSLGHVGHQSLVRYARIAPNGVKHRHSAPTGYPRRGGQRAVQVSARSG